ncbi:MAG: AmmeMemoRadiSam system protein B [Calditrichaeota bacterium]|nr:AmmeMemoRadiSam system protein B [Calditrichota bacterium]
MKRFILFSLSLFILTQGCQCQPSQDKVKDRNIRPPAVAGQFYPADPEKLRLAIDGFIKDAKADFKCEYKSAPVALIAPHAGYIYSGQIAADAYNQVKNFDYDLIIILGTNHTTGGFNDISVYPEGAYRTPLGLAEIDKGIAKKITQSDKNCVFNPAVHRKEHSVEVQIPFIQYLFPDAKIVPIVIGTTDLSICMKFGESLAEIIKDRKALIVASSDFSHYPNYENAKDVDGKVLDAIVSGEPQKVKSTIARQMRRGIANLSTCACGEGPILTAMYAARSLGVREGYRISYANSGDALIGKPDRVVGYGAMVFAFQAKSSSKSSDEILTRLSLGDEKTRLLKFAHETISRYLTTETVPLPRGFNYADAHKQGAFVTLNKHGNLRGCIGHMAEDMPLSRVIGSMAMQAAFNDRRFSPVTLDELDEIKIEISVLTPFKLVSGVDDIIIGRDGILIKKGGRQAVYLPQVATEQNWTLEETLNNLCRKAGLSRDDWHEDMEFYTFQADVFGEE